MNSEAVTEPVTPSESVAVTVKDWYPTAVDEAMVPLRSPFAASVRPAGSVPPVTANV